MATVTGGGTITGTDTISAAANTVVNNVVNSGSTGAATQSTVTGGTVVTVANTNGGTNAAIIPTGSSTTTSTVSGLGTVTTSSQTIVTAKTAAPIVVSSTSTGSTVQTAVQTSITSTITSQLGNTRTGNTSTQTDAAAKAGSYLAAKVSVTASSGTNIKVSTVALARKVKPAATLLLDDSDASHHNFTGVDSIVGANEVLVDTSATNDYDIFTLDLLESGGDSVVLKGVDAAVLLDSGRVRVEGNTPIIISSDSAAQNITGGGGNDTLIGTGNDTLTGGSGDDIFGINAAGKYVITDFIRTLTRSLSNLLALPRWIS